MRAGRARRTCDVVHHWPLLPLLRGPRQAVTPAMMRRRGRRRRARRARAAAILLAERGWSVTLLDKAAFPRPKICGEYLSPEAARVLDRLGVLKAVDAAGAQPLARHAHRRAGRHRARSARYPTGGRWRGYRDHALAIPREVFDRILLERARALPVDVRERHRVTGLLRRGRQRAGRAGGGRGGRAASRCESRLVVGADGRASVVARALGLVRPHRLRRLALIQHVERHRGARRRSRRDLRRPARLLHPESRWRRASST